MRLFFFHFKIGLIFIFAMSLGSCSSLYLPMRVSDIKVNPDSSYYKIIPIPDEYLNQSLILSNVCHALYYHNHRTAKRYLRAVHKHDSLKTDYYVSAALYHLCVNNFEAARDDLFSINNNDYLFLRKFLTIEVNYELVKWLDSYRSGDYMLQYQNLLDENSHNHIICKIIVNHARYARYRQ